MKPHAANAQTVEMDIWASMASGSRSKHTLPIIIPTEKQRRTWSSRKDFAARVGINANPTREMRETQKTDMMVNNQVMIYVNVYFLGGFFQEDTKLGQKISNSNEKNIK